MERHFFKEGSLDEFFPKYDGIGDEFFEKSKQRIVFTLPLFDIERYKNTNYFYIYKACGASEKRFDKQEVEDAMKKLLNHDFSNVENEYTSFGIPDKDIESDIFWDTENDIIFVKGMKNARLVCIELLINGFTRLGQKRSEEMEAAHICAASDTEVIVKTALSDEWLNEEELEELDNIQRGRR